MGKGQKDDIGKIGDRFGRGVRVNQIRHPGKNGIDFGDRNPGKPPGGRSHDLRTGMADEQPQQLLPCVSASPVNSRP